MWCGDHGHDRRPKLAVLVLVSKSMFLVLQSWSHPNASASQQVKTHHENTQTQKLLADFRYKDYKYHYLPCVDWVTELLCSGTGLSSVSVLGLGLAHVLTFVGKVSFDHRVENISFEGSSLISAVPVVWIHLPLQCILYVNHYRECISSLFHTETPDRRRHARRHIS